MSEVYKKDYFFEFYGWNNIKSRVHIRILHKKGKPLIVVCSQPLYGAGTSVQNAYKIIKKHLMPIFELRLGYHKPQTNKERLLDILEKIKKNKKILATISIMALEVISNYLIKEQYHRYKLEKDLNVVWFEHWPKGTDSLMGSRDDYLHVRENPETGNPYHERVDDRFIELFDYDLNDILKHEEIFINDPLAA